MAIKIQGTTVIDDSRNLLNIDNLQNVAFTAEYTDLLNTPVIGTDVLAYDSNLQGFVDAFTLPTTDGDDRQILMTDGNGNITFQFADKLTQGTVNKYGVFDVSNQLSSVNYIRNLDVVTNLADFAINDDGTKMLILDDSDDALKSYDLSTPWNISTASETANISLNNNINSVESIKFSSDGKYVIISDNTYDEVTSIPLANEYDLSAFDLNRSVQNVASLVGTSLNLSDAEFNDDGTRMYILDNGLDQIIQFNLSTAYDVSTATLQANVDVSAQFNNNIQKFVFNTDGSKLYIGGIANSEAVGLGEIPLSVPWEISSADVGSINFRKFYDEDNVSSSYYGFTYGSNGNIAVIASSKSTYTEGIGVYNLNEPYDITTATTQPEYTVDFYTDLSLILQYIAFSDDGTKFYGIVNTGTLYQFDLSEAWNVATANTSAATNSFSGFPANPNDFTFSSDGTKFYTIETGTDDVIEYTMSEAWNVATASATANTPLTFSDPGYGAEMSFSSNGSLMYIGSTSKVSEYELSEAWNPQSAILPSVNEYSWGETIRGMHFKEDGTSIYVISSTSNSVIEFSLSQAWNVATANATSSVDVTSEVGSNGSAITISADGNHLVIGNYAGSDIYYYTMSAFNLASLSYVGNSNTVNYGAAAGNDARSLSYSSDGSYLYHTHDVDNIAGISVFELGSAYDASNIISGTQSLPLYDTRWSSFRWNWDRTNHYMWQLNTSTDSVRLSELSANGDPTTANFPGQIYQFTEDANPYSVDFKPDGTRMYMMGISNDRFYEYTLSTPWDLSTVTYTENYYDISTPSNPSFWNFKFKEDGTKLVGWSGSYLYTYNLSEAWNVATMEYYSNSQSAGVMGNSGTFHISSDGTRIVAIDAQYDISRTYLLDVPWDVSSIKQFGANSATIGTVNGANILFSEDGRDAWWNNNTGGQAIKLTYANPFDSSTLDNYSASNPYDTLLEFDAGWSSAVYDGGIYLKDDQTLMLYDRVKRAAYKFDMSSNNDIETLALANGQIFGYQQSSYGEYPTLVGPSSESLPDSITFSSNGDVMVIHGYSVDRMYHFDLKTPWDITSWTQKSAYNLADKHADWEINSQVYQMAFSNDGTIFTYNGSNGYHRLSLDEPWQLNSRAKWTNYRHGNGAERNGTNINTINGLNINSAGDTFWALADNIESIFEFKLETANDLTSDFYLTKSWPISPTVANKRALAFNDDGTRLYISNTQYSIGYSLSTAYDFSTMAPLSTNGYKFPGLESSFKSITLDAEGLNLYITGTSADKIAQYSLSDSFDVSNAQYVGELNSPVTNPDTIEVDDSGKYLYVSTVNGNYWKRLELSTNNDITTATIETSEENWHFDGQDLLEEGASFGYDGTKLYTTSTSLDHLIQFELAGAYDITTATQKGKGISLGFNPSSVVATENDEGIWVFDQTTPVPIKYNMSTNGDISTATSGNTGMSFSGPGSEGTLRGIDMNADGTVVWLGEAGTNTGRIFQFDTNAAYDTSTITTDQVFEHGIANAQGFVLSANQHMLYIVNNITADNKIRSYSLTEDGNVATAVANTSLDIDTFDDEPRDIAFSSNGSIMFVLGSENDSVYQFDLSTPWDIDTASFSNSFSVASEDNDPRGISFRGNGTTMIITGNQFDSVYEYGLTFSWDISSASYTRTGNTNVTVSSGVHINPTTGDSLFIVNSDSSERAIYDYDLTGFNVGTVSLNDVLFLGNTTYDTPDIVGAQFVANGTAIWVASDDLNAAYRYDLKRPYDLQTLKYPVPISGSSDYASIQNAPYGIHVTDDESLLVSAGASGVIKYVPVSSGDWSNTTSTAVTMAELNLAGKDPRGLTFTDDGNTMLITTYKNSMFKLSLDTPYTWDEIGGGVNIVSALNIANGNFIGNVTDYQLTANSTQLVVMSNGSKYIHTAELEVPGDISTIKYPFVGSELAEPDNFTTLHISNDGTYVYAANTTTGLYQYDSSVYKIDLATGNYFEVNPETSIVKIDLENASGNFEFKAKINESVEPYTFTSAIKKDINEPVYSPTTLSLYFNNDGTQLIEVRYGGTPGVVDHRIYELLTPWDINSVGGVAESTKSFELPYVNAVMTPDGKNMVGMNSNTAGATHTITSYPVQEAGNVYVDSDGIAANTTVTGVIVPQSNNAAGESMVRSPIRFNETGDKMYIGFVDGDNYAGFAEYTLPVNFQPTSLDNKSPSTYVMFTDYAVAAADAYLDMSPNGQYLLTSANTTTHVLRELATPYDLTSNATIVDTVTTLDTGNTEIIRIENNGKLLVGGIDFYELTPRTRLIWPENVVGSRMSTDQLYQGISVDAGSNWYINGI